MNIFSSILFCIIFLVAQPILAASPLQYLEKRFEESKMNIKALMDAEKITILDLQKLNSQLDQIEKDISAAQSLYEESLELFNRSHSRLIELKKNQKEKLNSFHSSYISLLQHKKNTHSNSLLNRYYHTMRLHQHFTRHEYLQLQSKKLQNNIKAIEDTKIEHARMLSLIEEQHSLNQSALQHRHEILDKLSEMKELNIQEIRNIVQERKRAWQKLSARPEHLNTRDEIQRIPMRAPVDLPVFRSFGQVYDLGQSHTLTLHGWHYTIREGQNIKAAADGQVIYQGNVRGYGTMVILQHQHQIYSLYGHLQKSLVVLGDHVKEGATIATGGQSESFEGPLLYFEIRRGTQAVDPALFISAR